MTEIDLLLPFALPPKSLAADLLRELNLPALAMLISRAKPAKSTTRHECGEDFFRCLPHEMWLSNRFGLGEATQKSGSPPIARNLMSSMGVNVEQDDWFVLQPVHIHIARDHLVLTDTRQLALSEADSRTLFSLAAPLFEEAGKELRYGDAETWFVRAESWRELQTATPDAASGHSIDIWMPKGPQERDWRKVQNEVQMHWFNHPVNEDREARGLKPVNSVWLWGGPSSSSPSVSSPYDATFKLTGWMRAFGLGKAQHEPDTANSLLSSLGPRNLLMLDALLEPALSNNWAGWIDAMRSLEERWFLPLLQALRSGRFTHINLVLTDDETTSRHAVTRSSLRKFWVKPTLATLCP